MGRCNLGRAHFSRGVLLIGAFCIVAGARDVAQSQSSYSEDAVARADRAQWQRYQRKHLSSRQFHSHRPVCVEGLIRCASRVAVDSSGHLLRLSPSAAFSPAQLAAAYGIAAPSPANSHPLIAIVDAFDDPKIIDDLHKYQNDFHLAQTPVCPGSVASAKTACIQKVDQNGGTAYPKPDPKEGWQLETSLDVEIVAGLCPECRILLVESSTTSFDDLGKAELTALRLGAKIVSNSWGGAESETQGKYDQYFSHVGAALVFAAGDLGFVAGASYPASVPNTVSVGGTWLFLDQSNNWSVEEAWIGTGSGCSQYESKPAWQHDNACKTRTQVDVAADASPNTGVMIWTTAIRSYGWYELGGTSLAAPIIAVAFAKSGYLPSSMPASEIPYVKPNTSKYFHDVTVGGNGNCLPISQCMAGPGFDGPTGLGTPNTSNGF